MYHKVTSQDCLSMASNDENLRLNTISDLRLLKNLANRWCVSNDYHLGGYLGNWNWDSWSTQTARLACKEVKDADRNTG